MFLAEHLTCTACGTIATVVDHKTPHRGDQRLFWDRSNWQAQCAECHNRKTATRDSNFARRTNEKRTTNATNSGELQQRVSAEPRQTVQSRDMSYEDTGF